jgi:hypothetical protein
VFVIAKAIIVTLEVNLDFVGLTHSCGWRVGSFARTRCMTGRWMSTGRDIGSKEGEDL